MQKIFSFLRTRAIAVGMVVTMLFSVMCPANAFAAETETNSQSKIESQEITTRAGVETLPYGMYDIGAFTFTDNNYTPVKTVEGSVVSFGFLFQKASIDQGIGPVKLTVQICDENCNPISPKWEYALNSDSAMMGVYTPDFNLGYAGRKIRVFCDASSVGASNGHYRSIWVRSFTSYVQ